MKKLFAALIASVLMIPALATSAVAGDPYPGTVDTTTKFKAPDQVEAGEQFKVTVSVGAPAARADTPCKGKFVVKITKGDMSKKKSSNTGGASKTFKFALDKTGVWKIHASFKPAKNNPCQPSKKTKPIQVTK
jgi:hypothetical protein